MDPIALAEQIQERYRNYLSTFFHIKNPELRDSFESSLQEGHLTRGPYLQGTPVFKRGLSLAALYKEQYGSALEDSVSRALGADRRLYLHQEHAIRRVLAGKNVVVSTGTGSGKTEAFLYPIILHLLQESINGTLADGVRALVLYPMNALANDQRDRLVAAPIGHDAKPGILNALDAEGSRFSFTVGQYIGETPEDENDTYRKGREYKTRAMPGELVFRAKMRQTPPNILLTNFSMLEYLLLRPDDSPLFDGSNAKSWTFLVLDEAHQYRGSRGIEMSMLLRRLKQRVRSAGFNNSFRCIATSASLIDEEGSLSEVAKFASTLFDEPFETDDIITGTPEEADYSTSGKLAPQHYELLRTVYDQETRDSNQTINDLARSLGIAQNLQQFPNLASKVHCLLSQDERVAELRRILAERPVDVRELADRLFPDVSTDLRLQSLSTLVQLCLTSTDEHSGAPLLSARYHYFLRALEGAFIVFSPKEKIVLNRVASSTNSAKGYELAFCRECGQHYLVGHVRDNQLIEAARDPASDTFGTEFFLPAKDLPEDAEESEHSRWFLCLECGLIWQARTERMCSHDKLLELIRQQSKVGQDDKAKDCAVCGYAVQDPLREVSHGTDGPHAVIATTLYQTLPKDRSKILAFADGRQDAAFFAWYLETSYRELLDRNLLYSALRQIDSENGATLSEAASALRDVLLERSIYPKHTGDRDILKNAWLTVYKELLTNKQRISLEGVGLIDWDYRLPPSFQIPKSLSLPPWNLTDNECLEVVKALIDTTRITRAVEIQVDKCSSISWDELGLQGGQVSLCIGAPRNQHGVISWDGKTGRRSLLRKLLERIAKTADTSAITEALSNVWDAMEDYDNLVSQDERILLSAPGGKRINPLWWRLKTVKPENLYVCDRCGKIDHLMLHFLCRKHACGGSLRTVNGNDLQTNHYRTLYCSALPGLLRVEEHTAQLDTERAKEFQRDFKEGRINVLSCSTTFELGVDLGDLDTVFLRNVPPESFNYDQRVGRSGRRTGHAGFAITFCKRGSHDLYHFADPLRMIIGKVKPPIISISNDKIVLRHLTAVALSEFFRANKSRFVTLKDLVADFDHPSARKDVMHFLNDHRQKLEHIFDEIVPSDQPDLRSRLGLDDGSWINLLAGADSKLDLAEAEVVDDYRSVIRYKNNSANEEDYKAANWAKSRANTILGEPVLTFLSRKTVIPKYGFPVDVVELDTNKRDRNSVDVAFSRDLSIAISEFAPGAKLIANKLEWKSFGLKKVADKGLPINQYWRCTTHNRFVQWPKSESHTPPPNPCGCENAILGTYVIPLFGFVTSKDPPEKPKGRVQRVYSTRPYFLNQDRIETSAIALPPDNPIVTVSRSSPGRMIVLCEGKKGEGFSICQTCGAGQSKEPTKARKKTQPGHLDHQGRKCTGTIDNAVSLGHEFATDIVRIQFSEPREVNTLWFAYSLASAIVEGAAQVLEVPTADISVTVGHIDGQNLPPIYIYDNVPGGAGLVAKLETVDVFESVLAAAIKRVGGRCGCDPDTSCYGCLRSYRNQFAHNWLKRGPVHSYLSVILNAITSPYLDLFASKWHPLITQICNTPGYKITGGADVDHDGIVVGSYVAEVAKDGRSLMILDKDSQDGAEVEAALKTRSLNCLALCAADDTRANVDTVQRYLDEVN